MMRVTGIVAVLALFAVSGRTEPAEDQPNIVVVLVDDLGWNHLSSEAATSGTAQSFCRTPNIDRLADSGVSFPHCYSQPNCAPSRAALLTGQYPARKNNEVYNVGSLNRFDKGFTKDMAKYNGAEQATTVNEEAVTVSEALRHNGYATAHIGKFHVGDPQAAGFDTNIGGSEQGHQPVCFAAKTKEGSWGFKNLGNGAFDRFALPYDKDYLQRRNLPAMLEGTSKHICDATGDAMVETIGKLAAGTKPFYLQFHTYAVHGPVQARPDLKQEAEAQLPKNGKKLANYAGFIAGVDENVGRLLAALEDPDGDGDTSDSIADDTIVFFSSDNGGTHAPNTPLKGTKGQFHEGGVRVPFIVHGPGRVAQGAVSGRTLHFVDLYPTLLELAGAKWKPDAEEHPLDGESFASALQNPAQAPDRRDPVFYLFPGYIGERAQPCVGLVGRENGKRFKLFYEYESDSWRLYDLDNDPAETENLVAELPDVAAALSQKLQAWLTQTHPTWQPRYPVAKSTGKAVPVPALP